MSEESRLLISPLGIIIHYYHHYINVTIIIGGGQEVGRSCIHVSYKTRSLLLDCGMHPGVEGMGSLPFFDKIDDM